MVCVQFLFSCCECDFTTHTNKNKFGGILVDSGFSYLICRQIAACRNFQLGICITKIQEFNVECCGKWWIKIKHQFNALSFRKPQLRIRKNDQMGRKRFFNVQVFQVNIWFAHIFYFHTVNVILQPMQIKIHLVEFSQIVIFLFNSKANCWI